jgi:hypothetical protein
MIRDLQILTLHSEGPGASLRSVLQTSFNRWFIHRLGASTPHFAREES